MRFRHKPVTNVLPEGETVFAQCTRTVKRTIILTKSFFPQNFLVDTMEAVLKFSLERVWQKAGNFPFNDRKRWKIFPFSNFFRLKELMRTRNMQFWQPSWKQNARRSEKTQSMSQTNEWIIEFFKSFCSENVFVDTYIAVLTTQLKNYRQRTGVLLLHVWRWFKKTQKTLSSKIHNKHVETRFQNPPEKLRQKRFRSLSQTYEKRFKFRNFLLKMFLWTRRMQFRHNSVTKTLPKSNSLRAKSKNDGKNFEISNENLSQKFVLDTKNAALTTAPKKSNLKANYVRFL